MILPKIDLQWNQLDAPAWEALLARAEQPTAYQQHWAYGAAGQSLGARVDRIVLHAGERRIGLVQLQYRRWWRLVRLASAMRGPVWLPGAGEAEKAAAYRQLRRAVTGPPRRFGLWMPEGDDAQALHQSRMHRVVTSYHTAMLDLRQPEAALRASMHGKWRNRLRAAERSPLEITPVALKPQRYQWLLQAEVNQQRQKRYTALPPALVPLLHRHGGKDSLLILQASLAREVVAAMLFLRHGVTATYHIGWASEAGKRVSAHNLLLWQAMLRLQAAGTRWLDLGGVATDQSPGIAHFKLGSGAALVRLSGTYF